MPMQLLVLKCNYKAVWPIRRLNCVLASTAGIGLKATASGFAKTRVVCILEQLWRVCFLLFKSFLNPPKTCLNPP